ncbi:hypothetical protein [Sphingomonas sp. BK069]|uniref:hypothetical protein n=1 Tax=Sphingomonas sp. BK069 TaxID=2586979 RepID=UPI00160B7B2E|nr:hypothetical protein [Sphingomonas sp. BK069]MBB3349460.1 hypothetical protein [Sphingomonas sp. BK069]
MGDQSPLWTEIRPIFGPLIQAAVVLIVGVWTIWFQLRQARTAERKLFTDLHDKRFKALSNFTRDIMDMVLTVLAEDDNRPPQSPLEEQARSRDLSARLEQLAWLFGSDVIFHLTQMLEHAERIMSTVSRLRHKLDSDDGVQLVQSLNVNNEALHAALASVNEAARHYLYVGHIRAQAPPSPAFTPEQLKGHTPPRRNR